MKLYTFTMTATVAAPNEMPATSLVEVSRSLKEEYSRQFMQGVLMSDVVIKVEPIYETTIS